MHVRGQTHYLHRFLQLELLLHCYVLDYVDCVVKEGDQEQERECKLKDEADDVLSVSWIRVSVDFNVGKVFRSLVGRSVNYFAFNRVLDGDKALWNVPRRVSTVVVVLVSRSNGKLVTQPKVGRPVEEKTGKVL